MKRASFLVLASASAGLLIAACSADLLHATDWPSGFSSGEAQALSELHTRNFM
ncbi:MAG: hypothetical protein WKG00_03755 [Polyangiaceae bacterium]